MTVTKVDAVDVAMRHLVVPQTLLA